MSKNVIVLGMSNACAVKLSSYGQPEIVRDPNEDSDSVECAVLPSSDSDGCLVGKSARTDNADALKSLKEFFADGKSDASEKCLAILFQYILEYARMNGEDFSKALICCPECFNHGVIHAAARKAGIIANPDCAEFVSSEEAVLAYCRKALNLRREAVLVCDLGGSRLDVYLLKTDKSLSGIEEGFSDCDHGGRQWTEAMKQLLLDKIAEEIGFMPEELEDDARLEIENMAVRIKERLSAKTSAQLRIRIYDEQYQLTINRGEFEAYARKYVDEMLCSIKNFVYDAGWEFDHILLLGGSSKMPMIRETIAKSFLDKEIINDNGCILAYGAAYAVNS